MELGHIGTRTNDDDEKHADGHDGDIDDIKTPMSYSLAAVQQQTAPPPRARTPLPKLSEADRAQLRASGSCFRCRQHGHVSRDCPLQYSNSRPKV